MWQLCRQCRHNTLQPEPLDGAKTALVVGGLAGFNDSIPFETATGGALLNYNGHLVGPLQFDGSIVAYGQSGNDILRAGPSMTRPMLLFGQDGNDILTGGQGADILAGGAGHDMLFGGGARDLLFGGLGSDVLHGDGPTGLPEFADADLLVADYFVWEGSPAMLASIREPRTAATSYNDRLQDLRYARQLAINNTTVFNDFAHDMLVGGAALDWFAALDLSEILDADKLEHALGFAATRGPRR
jgi:Ca2+-binding RTX toxin-like protein